MMTNKKRYIPPYIEIVEEEEDLLDGGLTATSEYDENDSRDAKGGSSFDDSDTPSSFNWDTPDTHEWEI